MPLRVHIRSQRRDHGQVEESRHVGWGRRLRVVKAQAGGEHGVA
jgi:hypothetical protein